MAVAFTNLSWWLWSGKHQGPKTSKTELSLWESDAVKFPRVNRGKVRSSSRKAKKKGQSREERKIDGEYDVVLVPSDGGCCVSGSESDDSDWSVGWLEPHGPEFQSDNDSDDSFAVLVPCYGRVQVATEDQFQGTTGVVPDIYAAESNKYLEQWISSLRSS